jgi:hypothetical protein
VREHWLGIAPKGERKPSFEKGLYMSSNELEDGGLPTTPVTKEQRVILVESMLVTWKVLEHLKEKGRLKPEADGQIVLRPDDKCCKPDGGTCCVNRKPTVMESNLPRMIDESSAAHDYF